MQIVPATRETRVLAEAAQRLLAEWLRAHPRAKLRLLGVGASDLQTAVQPDLFDAPVAIANRKLDAAVDAIKQRFGHDALSRANGLRAMHESVLGAYGKMLHM